MNNLLKKLKAWRSRLQQRSLERWERIRAEGKRRFVFNTSLTYGLTMVGLTDVVDHFFKSAPHWISLFSLIYYLLAGIPLAFIGWSSMETKYHKALHAACEPALSSGDHNSPLGITSNSKSTLS
jgi:hypothetical protein